MKIKKVMDMMKRIKVFNFYQEEDDDGNLVAPQWVGCGAAFYNLSGLPVIQNEDEFCAAYDIEKKDNLNINFTLLPKWMKPNRWEPGEIKAEELGVTVESKKGAFSVFRYGGRIMLVNPAFLQPFSKNDYTEYTVRTICISGNRVEVLFAFDGVDIQGIVAPVRVADEELLNNLRDIAAQIRNNIVEDEQKVISGEQTAIGEGDQSWT